MQVSVKIRQLFFTDNSMKAVASVTLDNAIAIHNVKVIETKKKRFIAFPSEEDKNGKRHDIVHPINQETRQLIETAVLNEYKLSFDTYVLMHADC